MMQPHAVILPHRGVLELAGPDVRSFLQGIVSNDVARVSTERAVWTAFLTPQGKFLHEFFLVERPGRDGAPVLWLDCERARRDDLLKRLTIYKLRAKVSLSDLGESHLVVALFDLKSDLKNICQLFDIEHSYVFQDPRLPALGARAIVPREGAEAALEAAGFRLAGLAAYDRLRIAQGVPDGSRDLEVGKSLLLESGFEELNGLDWDKGCYMGQELTARTKYRGLVKKRLLPVRIEGAAPPAGTPVMGGGREAGVLRSTADGLGLALLRLEHLDAAPLTAGSARLTPLKPDWVRL